MRGYTTKPIEQLSYTVYLKPSNKPFGYFQEYERQSFLKNILLNIQNWKRILEYRFHYYFYTSTIYNLYKKLTKPKNKYLSNGDKEVLDYMIEATKSNSGREVKLCIPMIYWNSIGLLTKSDLEQFITDNY